ncbi:MAG: dephospho-CoA kinase [Janthinobacterium lividum]
MLRVALTGGVGSGKSAAAAMLRDMGARISQSDEIGRDLMQPGQAVFAAIVERFGPAVLTPTGELDRAMLGQLAFTQGRLEDLNAIVHPAVIAAQAAWMEKIGLESRNAVAVVESALIFETQYDADGPVASGNGAPWRTRFDRIVVITAPLELRQQRYLERVRRAFPGQDVETIQMDFQSRAAAQWSDEKKAALADFVIANDGTLGELRLAMEHLYARLRQDATDEATEAM